MHKLLSQEEIDALFSARPYGGARLGAKPPGKPAPRTRREPSRKRNIEMILRLELPFSIRFHDSKMPLKEVLNLGAGSIIQLSKSIHDPVTIFVNHRPIATGELVTVNGSHAVRILEVESAVQRMRSLK